MAGSGWDNQLVSLIIISATGGFTGLFMYSPVPGPGNLVTSIAPAAGTDPFGNPYPSGVNVGKPTGVQMNLGVDSNGVGILMPLLNDPRWANPELIGGLQTAGPNTFAALALIGPGGHNSPFNDHVALTLNSSDLVSSSANMSGIYNNGTTDSFIWTVDFSGFSTFACSAITATQPGTGTSSANPPVSEIWHDMRPLQNSFVGTNAGFLPPQFRKVADGTIHFAGYVRTPPTTGNYNNVAFTTVPAAYRPPNVSPGRPQWCVTDAPMAAATPVKIIVKETGDVVFVNLPTSLAQTTIGIWGAYDLGNTGQILV